MKFYSRNRLINTVYHLSVNNNKGRAGGLINFLARKREGLLETGALFKREGLIEDLR